MKTRAQDGEVHGGGAAALGGHPLQQGRGVRAGRGHGVEDRFGRQAFSFVVVLPIALPGMVTGVALNSAFSTVLEPLGVGLGLFTVVVGHATFCIVVVFNNVVARLRRTSGSYEEAAMDLGANTFRATVFLPGGAGLRYLGLSVSANAGWPAGQFSEVEAYPTS